MTKKAKAEKTVEPPEANGSEESGLKAAKNKTDAIRIIREQLMAEGVRDPKPLDIYEHWEGTEWSIGDKKRDVEYITSVLSTLRRREREANQAASPGPKLAKTEAVTFDDMQAVLDCAEEMGLEIPELIGQVERIGQLADKVGGLAMLRQTLKAIALIRGIK